MLFTGSRLLVPLAVACAALACGSALAQADQSSRLSCHTVGTAPPEPLGDREGHSLSVSQITCCAEGGGLINFDLKFE
jgi:hypothetical protein